MTKAVVGELEEYRSIALDKSGKYDQQIPVTMQQVKIGALFATGVAGVASLAAFTVTPVGPLVLTGLAVTYAATVFSSISALVEKHKEDKTRGAHDKIKDAPNVEEINHSIVEKLQNGVASSLIVKLSDPLPTNVTLNKNESAVVDRLNNLRLSGENAHEACQAIEKSIGITSYKNSDVNWLKVAVARNDKLLIDSVCQYHIFSKQEQNDALGMAQKMGKAGTRLSTAIVTNDIKVTQELKLDRMNKNSFLPNVPGIEKVSLFGYLKETIKGMIAEGSKVETAMKAVNQGFSPKPF